MDADDYSTDDSSNKRRAAKGLGEPFERSKKVYRTPTKTNIREDDKLDLLLNMMQEMKSEQKEMRKEIQQNGEEQRKFSQELLKIKQENENLKRENAQIKKENELIKKELQEIKADLQVIQKDNKKNNVIISGLDIPTEDPLVVTETVTNFIKQNLKVNVQPKNIMKIGRKVCVMELKTAEDKREIMQNKANLKHITDPRVYINDDLTKYEREKQKFIRLKALEEKGKGKDVKVGYNKVIVDGNVWRWDKTKNTLLELNTKN